MRTIANKWIATAGAALVIAGQSFSAQAAPYLSLNVTAQPRCGAGSVSDLNLPQRALCRGSGRLRSPRRIGNDFGYQSTGQNGQQPDKRAAAPRENSSRAPASEPAHGSVDKAAVGSSANVLVATDEDYRIGSGDVIEVEVEDAPELSGNFRVTAAGTFLMHYLGRINAQNKTTEDLARFIANGLRERYIFDPRVIVTVKQYNSRAFFIQGAVHGAGVFQIEGRPSLLELITLAGGLQQNHSSTAFIIRKIRPPAAAPDRTLDTPGDDGNKDQAKGPASDRAQDAPAQYTLLKVNINGLLKGRFEQNMFLEPGDIVNIPPTEVFFVAGEVKQPGSFPLKEGTTLRQAISLAQGVNFTAAAGKGIIFRENADTGKRQEIAVDVGAVMSAKKEDMVLAPNDIILIPNSKMKKVAGPIISAFATNAIMLPMRY